MPPPPGPLQPGQPPLPPPGFVRINARHKISTSWTPPQITLDGHPVPMVQGQATIPVIPGTHLVAGHGQWLWKYGRAELPVQVASGQTVDVFYALPVATFVKGAIGFEPVKAPGKWALALLLLVLIGIPTLLVVLAAVLAS
ncbi:hypothetical protein [Nocardioides sp. AE5]|uniref:hypothetical protein n=1 Tax=Nocardioides sp. AE5 TaxID=2962573 RepID=UPI002881AC81|nr:hypothetical protein [Nocardioides sp. AE5]MDT0203080.1 hypothetical protein [Nocardioides sp. AE5]